MKDNRSSLGQQVSAEIKKHFTNSVYETTIPRNIRLAEAPSHGLPICMYDKSCVGAKSYMSLAEEILTKNGIAYKKPAVDDKRRAKK